MAGALTRAEYLDGLTGAGFVHAEVVFTHEAAPGMHGAIVRATKPAAGCCPPAEQQACCQPEDKAECCGTAGPDQIHQTSRSSSGRCASSRHLAEGHPQVWIICSEDSPRCG